MLCVMCVHESHSGVFGKVRYSRWMSLSLWMYVCAGDYLPASSFPSARDQHPAQEVVLRLTSAAVKYSNINITQSIRSIYSAADMG